jgi:hypothetical protein
MPRTIENIGFYSRLGFRPGHLTVSMTHDLDGPGRGSGTRLSALGVEDGLVRCRALVQSLTPGVDFSREISLTLEHGLGDVTLLPERGALAGFALWHAAPLAEGRSGEEVRVLKLAARDQASFRRVVEAVEADAWAARSRRVSIRCQSAYREAYGTLLDAEYRVHWTDLRMTFDGKGERPVAGGGVVFSNWEI